MKNVKFFLGELEQYGLSPAAKEYIKERMLDGVEIMTRTEISHTIEEYINSGEVK